MQRKYSEPNTYIDNPRNGRSQQDDLYDDVDVSDTVVSNGRGRVEGARNYERHENQYIFNIM